VGVNVLGKNNVGGVVGATYDGGGITNCYSTGVISGNNSIGGVAGTVYGSSNVTNCYSVTLISGNNNIGGVAGYIHSSSVTNCYSIGAISGNNEVGGVVGSILAAGTLTNCAALNPSVEVRTGDRGWRVAGSTATNVMLSRNVAFNDMAGYFFSTTGANTANGEDITANEIIVDGTIDSRFTTGNGWTIESGKLPGLLGRAVDLPVHLQINSASHPPADNEPPLTGELIAGPNPVGQSASINFFRQGKRIKNCTLTIYNASGDLVKKIVVVDDNAANVFVKRRVGLWDLTNAAGKPVPAGAHIVKGAITVIGGKRENISLVVGVR
jgi:hypothetical protein